MSELRIPLPPLKWLTGNDAENSCNEWNGSFGTDPFTGFTARTTFAYRAWFEMPPKPEKGQEPIAPLNIPFGFHVEARLYYPFGSKQPQSEPEHAYFEYEPDGNEPVLNDRCVKKGEQWLNDLLEKYIADGTVIPT